MELKYVMFNTSFPVIFGEYIEHKNVTTLMVPTSAGRFSIDFETKTIKTFGQSLGLRLEPAEKDEAILAGLFFNNYGNES